MYLVPPPLTKEVFAEFFALLAKEPQLQPSCPWRLGPKPPHWDEDIDELIAWQKQERRAHLRVVK
jgi:hypothetical protein